MAPYLLITFFFLVAAHYIEIESMPWKTHQPIRLLINYVIGTVGMLTPFVWWLLSSEKDARQIVIQLVCFVVVAGLAPITTHAIDNRKNKLHSLVDAKRKIEEQAEQIELLEKQLQDRRNEA
jgi:hypothetical protein